MPKLGVLAAVLAIMFRPLVGVLQRHNLKPTLAAGAVVLGLLLLGAGWLPHLAMQARRGQRVR
jgi:predicted PurR-regulated permease PerM